MKMRDVASKIDNTKEKRGIAAFGPQWNRTLIQTLNKYQQTLFIQWLRFQTIINTKIENQKIFQADLAFMLSQCNLSKPISISWVANSFFFTSSFNGCHSITINS
jgi:hypothetical protein